MKHEPHDFEAPTRRAELKEWLATLRGPGNALKYGSPKWQIERERRKEVDRACDEILDYLARHP